MEKLGAGLSREQLLEIVEKLAATSDSNKEIIVRESNRVGKRPGTDDKDKGAKSKPKKSRFDLSKFRQRHIAFQIQYDGRKFFGFAAQENGGVDTVENFFFQALERLNLIADRKSCGYSRCGRTDRGVSALGQIVALRVRSSVPLHEELTDETADNHEMDYCTMLNRCLPEEIRVLGWTAVTEEFSARFSASNRRYRYFFARRNLDIDAMQNACQYLLGSHDFRNICKLDVANVSNFVREIFSAEIKPFRVNEQDESIYMLEICGEGKEEPTITRDLLDLSVYPAKPSYMMAEDAPLVLHECAFDHLSLHHSTRSLWELTAHYRRMQDRHAVAMAQAYNSLQYIEHMCSVTRTDVESFKEELRKKQARVAERLQSKGISQRSVGKQLSAASVPTVEESEDDAAAAMKSKKRSFEDMNNPSASPLLLPPSALNVVPWSVVLQEIESELNMVPALDAAPHVPLVQRKVEESYEERVKALVGQKKSRFDRHVQMRGGVEEGANVAAAGEGTSGAAESASGGKAMATAAEPDAQHEWEDNGPQSATTKAFFAHMRQQGSISLLGGYAVHHHSASTTVHPASNLTTSVTQVDHRTVSADPNSMDEC